MGDALLIFIMYALKLRTGGIKLLKFKDGNNKDLSTIKCIDLKKEKKSSSIFLKHFTIK